MQRKKCEECGGKIIKKEVDFSMYGKSLGKFPAEVCQKCKEEVFDENAMEKIETIAKRKGLWGLEAKTKITQLGTTLGIGFPQKIIKFLHLKKGEEVTIQPSKDGARIIL